MGRMGARGKGGRSDRTQKGGKVTGEGEGVMNAVMAVETTALAISGSIMHPYVIK